MAGHTFSDKDKQVFEPLPEGNYEVVIDNIEKREFTEKTGTNAGNKNIYLRITYKIRDDQKPALQYAGRKVSDNIMPTYNMDKKQFVQNDGWVDFARLFKLLKTQEDFNGYKTDFDEGIEEYILFMTGKTLVINVGQRENEYNGETNTVNVVRGFSKTSLGSYTDKKTDVIAELVSGGFASISDDDLPF